MLGDVFNLFAAGKIPHAAIKSFQLFHGERILQAPHGSFMANGLKTFAWSAAYALGGRVRRAQLGVRIFERLELVHQAIVGRVGNLRIVFYVIKIFMMTKFIAQPLYFLRNVWTFRHGNPVRMQSVQPAEYYTMRPCSRRSM